MNETKEQAKEFPLKLLAAGVLFFIAVFLFAFLAKMVVIDKKDLFDTTVFSFLHRYTTPFLIKLMDIFTFFGSATFLFPAYVVLVVFLLLKKQTRWAVDIAIIGISSELLKLFLKNSFHRHRPDLPLIETLNSYSFPSGHALSSFIFFSILVYLLWKKDFNPAWKWIISILLILFSITIGISRIVLRYHYASDVVAGFCIGYSWVIFSLWLLNKIHVRMKGKKL
ncbi:MAG: phosphatase PAP2 family protein [Flavisolibacter sp.]